MSYHDGCVVPPSAAGFLEPYTVRVVIEPVAPYPEAAQFLCRLLEELAEASEAEGATLIGHIKCLLSMGDHRLSCNLTSRRTGASCGASPSGRLLLDQPAGLSLAVLVYGLAASSIAELARRVFDRLLLPGGASWRLA
jgi:hypothetical protein